MEELRATGGRTTAMRHSLILEDREKLTVSGVEDVESFDDETVILYTGQGMLTVKGVEFRINKLSVESGEVVVEGVIDSVLYTGADRPNKTGGFFSRMFK